MAFITVAGENQIALKQGGGQPLNVVSFVLANIAGLGAEPVDRIEAMPAAGDIQATLDVTDSGYVNTNQVVYSLVMDSTIGTWSFNWVGLVDADGVLIAATYIPLTEKKKTVGIIPGNNLTRNFLLAFSGIQATTAIDVPASTWQIDFTTRLLQIDDRERLSNFDIYGQASFFSAGWSVVRQGATDDYDVLPGVGYVGGIRIESTIASVITVSPAPKAVWLDVSLQGDINGVAAVTSIVVDAGALSDYTDGLGFDHYVTKIADIDASGNAIETRTIGTMIDDHEGKPDPHPQYLLRAEYLPEPQLVGERVVMTGSVAPAKCLVELGTELIRANYPDMWAWVALQSNLVAQATIDGDPLAYSGYYGTGDGTTTFTIRNTAGLHSRAADMGRGVDAGRVIGSYQADEIKNHNHNLNHVFGALGYYNFRSEYGGTATTVNTDYTGGPENRVKTIAELHCVRVLP